MNENKETNNSLDAQHNPVQGTPLENRQEARRREASEGFTYITIVGLIDRRERIRRKDDPFDF